MAAIDSTRDARDLVHADLPEAINFQPIEHRDQRIGWTYCTAPGVYGWVLTTGRTSTVQTTSREAAEHNARATHRP